MILTVEIVTYSGVVNKALLVERAQRLDLDQNKNRPGGQKSSGGNSKQTFWKGNDRKRNYGGGNENPNQQALLQKRHLIRQKMCYRNITITLFRVLTSPKLWYLRHFT